jgi:hypothetical protein
MELALIRNPPRRPITISITARKIIFPFQLSPATNRARPTMPPTPHNKNKNRSISNISIPNIINLLFRPLIEARGQILD